MVRGSCLCGGVSFEINRFVGPFELCHCSRCRKASGSAFDARIGVKRADFRFVQGADLIQTFELPVRESPPPYRAHFCRRCGSPVPDPNVDTAWLEVPAGLLDDDPQLHPDRHIFVDFKSPWFETMGDLPQLDRAALIKLRKAQVHQ